MSNDASHRPTRGRPPTGSIEWADEAKTIPAGVRPTKASGKRQFTRARGPWQVFIAIACHWQANAEEETSGRRPSFSSLPRATSARERSVRSRASTPVRSSRASYGAVVLFVFRTLEVDDAFAVTVPGVRPRVQLLMELGTAGRIRLARSLFAFLLRTGRIHRRCPTSSTSAPARRSEAGCPVTRSCSRCPPPSTGRACGSRAPRRKPNRSRPPHRPRRRARLAAGQRPSTGKPC